jgi:hypothetical protein
MLYYWYLSPWRGMLWKRLHTNQRRLLQGRWVVQCWKYLRHRYSDWSQGMLYGPSLYIEGWRSSGNHSKTCTHNPATSHHPTSTHNAGCSAAILLLHDHMVRIVFLHLRLMNDKLRPYGTGITTTTIMSMWPISTAQLSHPAESPHTTPRPTMEVTPPPPLQASARTAPR